MTALEAPFGQGVGAGYTLGAGIRAGGEQWYLDFKDSLYVGSLRASQWLSLVFCVIAAVD